MTDLSEQDWQTCLKVLQKVSEDTDLINENARFKTLISKIHKSGKKRQKASNRQALRHQDQQNKAKTGRVKLELGNTTTLVTYSSTLAQRLHKAAKCYICKAQYHKLDDFYHMLCPACAQINHQKRRQRTDLSGKIAIVTGGRIKIGYELVLKLLRDGATVLATSRFAVDALQRISKEPDFSQFKKRIHFYGLDLRHLPSVESFIAYVNERYDHIDMLINNAAQTLRRPANFYAELYDKEKSAELLPEPLQSLLTISSEAIVPNHCLQWAKAAYFPVGELDRFMQPIDKTPKNSWVTTLSDVSKIEFIEAQVINYFAPYLLTSGLKPLLERSPQLSKFVVNVSAMEGQFNRKSKTSFHPHTNMAKAALNMMTRTCAMDYAQTKIYMNSVDTGWVTQENPYPKAQRVLHGGFVPPLDEVDGAARIYDPIVQGYEGTLIYGHFLKDYQPYPW